MMQPKAISFESRALNSCNKAMDGKAVVNLTEQGIWHSLITAHSTRLNLQFSSSTVLAVGYRITWGCETLKPYGMRKDRGLGKSLNQTVLAESTGIF